MKKGTKQVICALLTAAFLLSALTVAAAADETSIEAGGNTGGAQAAETPQAVVIPEALSGTQGESAHAGSLVLRNELPAEAAPAAEGQDAAAKDAAEEPLVQAETAVQRPAVHAIAGGPILSCANLTETGETFLTQGSAFLPLQGVSARTAAGRDLSDRILVTGEVDSNTVGDYEIIYTVTDDVNRTATRLGVVHVVPAADMRFTQGIGAVITEQFPAPPFQTTGSFDTFVGIRIGGVYLTRAQYVAVPAGTFGTSLHFTPEYGRGLAVGQYLLEAVYRDGICATLISVGARAEGTPRPATPTDLARPAAQQTAESTQTGAAAQQTAESTQTGAAAQQTAEPAQTDAAAQQTAEPAQTGAAAQTVPAMPNTGAAL